jgi:peptide/nickel transport system permease protein
MGAYLVKRCLSGATVIIALIVFAFFATHYIGDPTALMVDRELNTKEDRQRLIEAGGFDRPVYEQFIDFAGGAIQGDFGRSIWQNRPASEVVIERLPATALLTGSAIVFIALVSIPAAVFGARNRGKWPETVVTTISTAFASFTSFWLALALILLLAVEANVLPTSGYGVFPELILPVIALSTPAIGHVTQIMQSALVYEFNQPYVRTARAKGLSESAIARTHVLRNAAIICLTILGGLVATLMSGTVLIESIFGWPGLGQVSLQAIERRDLPVLMASVFYMGVLVTVVNMLVDFAYASVDPRVSLQ